MCKEKSGGQSKTGDPGLAEQVADNGGFAGRGLVSGYEFGTDQLKCQADTGRQLKQRDRGIDVAECGRAQHSGHNHVVGKVENVHQHHGDEHDGAAVQHIGTGAALWTHLSLGH